MNTARFARDGVRHHGDHHAEASVIADFLAVIGKATARQIAFAKRAKQRYRLGPDGSSNVDAALFVHQAGTVDGGFFRCCNGPVVGRAKARLHMVAAFSPVVTRKRTAYETAVRLECHLEAPVTPVWAGPGQ